MASNVTRDHHSLRRNLKLNGNYLSNDGGDEGILISNTGLVSMAFDNSAGASLIVGEDCTATGNGSIALGLDSDATADNAIAIGNECLASAAPSYALGKYVTASGVNSLALGAGGGGAGGVSTASGIESIVIGTGCTASAANSFAAVDGCTASAVNAVAIGSSTTASGIASVALGKDTTASGYNAFCHGRGMTVSGDYSFGIALESNSDTVSQANTMAVMGGKLGIGVIDPDQALEVNGDIHAENTIYFTAETANTIGDGATGAIDWNTSQKQKLTITGTGITCNFTNPAGACNLLLRVAQGDGSDVVATWDVDIKWAGGSAPTLSTGNGEIDILSFYWDGSKYYGVASLDFS